MQIQIKRSTSHLYMPAILMAFVAFLLVVAVVSAKIAKADGYEGTGGYKDGGYAYSHTPKRARLDPPHRLRAYLSPEELRTLKRIKAKAERRMMGYREPVRSRRVYAETRYEREPMRRVRYAEYRISRRETRRDYDDVERNIGRCGREVAAEGKKIWSWVGLNSAKREARLQWEREVQAKLGERYSDPSYARKLDGDGYICWKAGGSNRCSFTARPCRAGS
jgi:hypothetical protein